MVLGNPYKSASNSLFLWTCKMSNPRTGCCWFDGGLMVWISLIETLNPVLGIFLKGYGSGGVSPILMAYFVSSATLWRSVFSMMLFLRASIVLTLTFNDSAIWRVGRPSAIICSTSRSLTVSLTSGWFFLGVSFKIQSSTTTPVTLGLK